MKLIDFNYTPQKIMRIKKKIKETHNKWLTSIKLLYKKSELSPEYLFDSYLYYLADFNYIYGPISFLQNVSDSKDIRDASINFGEDLSLFFSRFYMSSQNYEIFLLLKRLPSSKIIDTILKSFEYNGIMLSPAKKKLFKSNNNTLNKLDISFDKNISNDNRKLFLTEDEIKGISPEFLQNKRKNNNKYIIGTSKPEMNDVLKNCEVEETRRKMYYLYNNIAYPKNMDVLEKILEYRQKNALLLGYKNTVDLMLSYDRIATLPGINDLLMKLIPILKKRVIKRYKDVYDYNMAYLLEKYRKEHFDLDQNEIKLFFPTNIVIKRVFSVYEKLFSITIRRVKTTPKQVWHKDVLVYIIYDTSDKKTPLGYLYLDLFPRDNKFVHAATYDLQAQYINKDNIRIIPATAIVCNFALLHLTHGEVITFCHEMGHALHNIFSNGRFESLAGTSVERDFVETVSQLFENWCWEPKFLRYISEPKIPIPIIKKIIKTRYFNHHMHLLTQVLYLKYDLAINDGTPYNKAQLQDKWFSIAHNLLPFKLSSPYIHPMCSFGHLVGGYEAGYYSYLWSNIYAYDIYSEFKKNGILNPKMGKRLREKIMERGGHVSGIQLLRDFLGRKESFTPFLKIL
jgi:Zn-dependent oligopeptidase